MLNDPTYVMAQIEANPAWHIAWLLSEMRNDVAPIGWSRYIPDARLILEHYEATSRAKERTMPHDPTYPQMIDGVPRRIRVDLYTPAERAIADAIRVVEEAGADVLLTEAVNLLHQAQNKVADFVERAPEPIGENEP